MRAIDDVQLKLDGGQAIAELGVLVGVSLLIDLIVDPEVEQPVLLSDQERLLPLEFGPLGT